jgi:hypothetical protein
MNGIFGIDVLEGRNRCGWNIDLRISPGLRQPWALGRNRFAVKPSPAFGTLLCGCGYSGESRDLLLERLTGYWPSVNDSAIGTTLHQAAISIASCFV